jgi:hypothetical protein
MPQRATRGSDLPRVACSVDIDLVISPENKFMLTHQRPIVRTVIQEGIENLRAVLLFTNVFPDVCVVLTLIKDSLLNAADHYGHMPGAMDILKQLIHNKDYLLKITPLVRPLYPEMTALTTLPSHVLGSACFEAKSRSGATSSPQECSLHLVRLQILSNMFGNSSRNTPILFR